MSTVIDGTLSDLYPDVQVIVEELGKDDRVYYAYRRPTDAAGPVGAEEALLARGLLLGTLRYAPNGPRDDAFWLDDDGEYYTSPREWLGFLSEREMPQG